MSRVFAWAGARATRAYSVSAPRSAARVTVRDLFRTPVFKSGLYTVVFGAAVIEYMKARKDLEGLERAYQLKFGILRDVIERLEKGEKVDLAQELRIANTLTRYRYGAVTDVELDEVVEDFLREVEAVPPSPPEAVAVGLAGPVDNSKFL